MSTLLKKLTRTSFVVASMLFAYTHAQAQSIVPASFPDQPIATASNVQTVNCDMLECPLQGGVRLNAIVWDDATTQSCTLYVDYTGNPSPVQLPFPPTPSGATFLPDVIIGNARPNGPKKGTHVIGVIYLDQVNYITYYSWYYVNGVGGPLSVTYAGTIPLSGAFGQSKYPHIDAFADHKNLTGGLPSMYDFAATWEEITPTGIITVGAIGSIENPTFVPTYPISTGSPHNEMPDVACITDVTTGARTALFAYNHQWTTEYSEFDVASSTVTFSTMYSTASRRVRIEAMNLYTGNPSFTKYQIAAENWSYSDVECANNNYYPTVWGAPLTNANASLFPTASAYASPAVAAGIGIVGLPSNIGNQVYSIGMNIVGTGNFYGRQIDVISGTFPGTPGGNDYYAINQNPIPAAYYPLALSSSSNSGYDLLSAWFDGNSIMHKFSNNMFAFKNATGVSTVGQEAIFTLSPNPAQNEITIKGNSKANYMIKDITGRMISQGKLNGYATSVDISTLSKGLYLINVYENGQMHASKFVKE
jgi:hypothetical protein